MNKNKKTPHIKSEHISGWQQFSEGDLVPKSVDISIDPSPQNFNDFWERYKNCLQSSNQASKIAQVSSVLVRLLIPKWGGPTIKGKRASAKEIDAGFQFLKKIPISVLEEESLQEILKGANKQSRSIILKMVEWAREKHWIAPAEESQPEFFYRFRKVKEARPERLDIKDVKYTERGNGKKIMLGLFDEDYLILPNPDDVSISLPPTKWIFHKIGFYLIWIEYTKVVPKHYLANISLERDLERMSQFFTNVISLRLPTATNYYENLLRFLGWLHRQKKVPLKELSLGSLVPYIQLYFKLPDCLDLSGTPDFSQQIMKQAIAREEAKELAKAKADLLEEYTQNTKMYPGSVVRQFTTAINLAKFVYYKETEEFKLNGGYEDIPFVQEFKSRRTVYERQTRKPGGKVRTLIPEGEKFISWPDVLKAVDKARIEATLTHKYYKRHHTKNKSGKTKYDRAERAPKGIARSFQNFMILALTTAMPPRRPRIYYELEIGKTFLNGDLKNGKFISVEKLANSAQAKYWIHLQEDDYKTGETYGEYWAKIPNIIYSDGVTLYDYIEQWLTKWRSHFAQSHNYLFSQDNDRPFNQSSWGKKFQRIMYNLANHKMNPHSLRHSFVTYLKDLGTPHEVMQTVAYAMAHSEETQGKIYSQQEQANRISPALDTVLNLSNKFFEDLRNDQVK